MNLTKIIKNVSYLFMGNMIIRFLLAISTIYFARYTGAAEYGILTIALAFTAIVSFFTDAGLGQTFLREGTKIGANLGELLSSYIRVRMVLTVVVTIFTIFFVQLFYQDAHLKNIIYWIAIPTIFGAAFQGVGTVYFQTIEKMQFTAAIQIFQGLGNATALILGMLFKFPLLIIAVLYGFSSVLVGIFSIIIVVRKVKIHRGWDKRILHELLTFTINGVILMIIPQLGPIILERVMSLEDVGYFSTAFKIPSVLYQIPGIIATAFYPGLFKYGNSGDLDTHRKLSQFELKLMSFLGISAALPFIVDPYFWITFLLGEEWKVSADALSILSFLVVFKALNFPLADFLTTNGNQMKRTIVMGMGLVISILGYSILGARFGLIGGAVAPIITEAFLLIGFCFFIPKGFSFLAKGIWINILGAIIAISIFKLFLGSIFPIVGFIIIEIIYILIILVCDKQIYKLLKRFLRKKSLKLLLGH